MRKTHQIFVCLAVAVMSTTLFFVSKEDRDPSQPPVVHTPEASPAETNTQAVSAPAPTAPPPASEKIQLRLASDPGNLLEKIRLLPGLETAEFDSKSSNLLISQRPGGPSAKELAKAAEEAGLVVRGEVKDLPLTFANSHLETCGSCGLVIYEQLQQKTGIRAVEVFLPVKNQLRLLVEPSSNPAPEIAEFLSKSRHPGASAP